MRQVHKRISLIAAVLLRIFGTRSVILAQRLTSDEDEVHHDDAPKALAMVAGAYEPSLQHYQHR